MKQPHIILLIADQLRRSVLGCYGGPFGATPNLDALAGSSVRFDSHATNSPLCVPARNALATGAWPHTNGAMVNAWVPEEEPWGTCKGVESYYERLAGAGYDVQHVGIDHMRADPPLPDRHERITFDLTRKQHQEYLRSLGLDEPAWPQCKTPTLEYALGKPYVTTYTNPNTGQWPHEAEHFFDLWLADRIVERIETADPSQPLALMGMFWSPHCPLVAPEPYYSMFDPDALELPDNVGRWTQGHSPMHLTTLTGHVGASLTIEQWRKSWAVYLGLVRMLDEAVGRVLDALKRRGFWDDALVVFTSDHGEMLGSHRMFQKMCMYEDSIRVPMLVKAPGPDMPGDERIQLSQHLDLAATFCDYAGIEPPARNQGQSIRPIVENPAAPDRDAIFCEFNGNSGRSFQQRCVITPTHKFIYNHGWDEELYDLAADPGEATNLCQADPPPPQADVLRTRLADWMRETNDYLEMELPAG